MDNVTAEELNDDILNCDLFKCNQCKKILRLPIRYVEDVGNFCKGCAPTDSISKQNLELENVFMKLIVPCRFEPNGCKTKCNIQLVERHESTCNFHSLVCPYTYFNECSEEWITNIADHFLEKHTHSIIITETDTINLNLHIDAAYNQLNLLVIRNEKFLVRNVKEIDDDKVYYFVYYMGGINNLDDFICTIDFVTKNTKIETSVSLLHVSMLSASYNKANAASFNMTLLQEIFEDNVNISVKILLKSSLYSESDERLLNCFECPVCNLPMRPPILQCLSGHSICNKCRPRINHCPTCRSNYGSTRNYTLENLSMSIKYPCTFRDLGCRGVFPVSDINRHENECLLKPFNCPFSEHLHCVWDGPLNSIVGHVKVVHPDQIVFNNVHMETIPYSNDNQFFHMKILVAYGKIFRLCHQRHIGNQNGYWSVQLIGAKGEAKNYTCHIGLVDLKHPNRKLIRTDLCQDMSTQDFMFNQCIVMPLNVVYWFSNNGQLQFYYKVVNHVSTTT